MRDNENMVCIATVSNRTEAEFVAGFLEDAGIEVMIDGDDCGGNNPILYILSRGVKVMVGEADVPKANALLQELDAESGDGEDVDEDGFEDEEAGEPEV